MTTPPIGLIILSLFSALTAVATGADATRITVTLDRGRDLGQSFGSLFELSSEDTDLVIGAGFKTPTTRSSVRTGTPCNSSFDRRVVRGQ